MNPVTSRSRTQATRTAQPAPSAAAEAAAIAEAARLAALLRGVAARDESALAAFYDATVSRAYAMALRVTGNAACAEEVVADAYLQVWRDAGRYDAGRSRPLTWLLMICRSRALDERRARDPALLHDAPETLVADGALGVADDPVDLLMAIDARHAVHAALGTLSAVQRQMLALAFFRGLSHHEIAAHTQLPLGTVKSQIRRALDALKRQLALDQGA